MTEIVKIFLTNKRLNKLLRGETILVPHCDIMAGNGLTVFVSKLQKRDLLYNKEKMKGYKLKLNEIALDKMKELKKGKGFWEDLGQIAQTVAKEAIKNPTVKSGLKKKASEFGVPSFVSNALLGDGIYELWKKGGALGDLSYSPDDSLLVPEALGAYGQFFVKQQQKETATTPTNPLTTSKTRQKKTMKEGGSFLPAGRVGNSIYMDGRGMKKRGMGDVGSFNPAGSH